MKGRKIKTIESHQWKLFFNSSLFYRAQQSDGSTGSVSGESAPPSLLEVTAISPRHMLVQCPMCPSLSCLSLHLWISSCSSVHLPLSATCQFLSLHFTLLLCLSSCWLPLFIVSAVILTALPVPVVAFVQNLISPVCPPVHKARLLGHPDSIPVSSYPLYIPALASLQALLLSNAIQSLQSHFIDAEAAHRSFSLLFFKWDYTCVIQSNYYGWVMLE